MIFRFLVGCDDAGARIEWREFRGCEPQGATAGGCVVKGNGMYSWDLLHDCDLDDLRRLLAGEEPDFDDYTEWVKQDRLAAERVMRQFTAFARECEKHYPVEVDQEEFETLLHAHLLLGDESLYAHPQYETSPNQLMRAVEVLLTANREQVERARYSECALVRAAGELNASVKNSRFEQELLVDEGDTVYEACDCMPAEVSMRATLAHYRLACPDPGESGSGLRQRGRTWWATHAAPTAFDDYRFHEVAAEYLLGPVPDHFSLSYDGHGVNSYALTVRFAVGELACIMQIGYGGAYGDQDLERETWTDVVGVVNRLREAAEAGASVLAGQGGANAGGLANVPRQRNLVLAYSDFRLGPDSQVLQEYRDGAWHAVALDGAAAQHLERRGGEPDISTAFEFAERAITLLTG